MSLIPWKPFWEIDKLFDDDWSEDLTDRPRWGRILANQESSIIRAPKMDIYEENNNIVAEVELPKVDPKNIDLEIRDNILKLEARTEEKKEEKKKGYFRKEISSGFFKRILPLPAEVVADKAEADYKEGILKIIIPKVKVKKQINKAKKIKIKGK
jgi:HSP20 family protein